MGRPGAETTFEHMLSRADASDSHTLPIDGFLRISSGLSVNAEIEAMYLRGMVVHYFPVAVQAIIDTVCRILTVCSITGSAAPSPATASYAPARYYAARGKV